MVFRKLIIQKSSIAILWRHLSKRRQKQFSLLLILMILAMFAEIISIGALLPFIGILTAQEQVYQHSLMQPVIQILAITEPKQLILLSPYYNFPDLVKGLISPIFPTFILKYKFATNEYLKTCGMPITIFHGNKDNLIPYESSLKLKAEFENKTNLIMLEGEGHNFYDNEKFKEEMARILNK